MVALNALFVSTSDLEEILINKDTGLPLSQGLIYFYSAAQPNVLKPVYQLTGAYPTYSYVPLPNPMTLSAVGTTQNAGGDNVDILYYPWTPNYGTAGDPVLDLYYVVVTDSAGNVQFTRNPWPPTIAESTTAMEEADNFISNQIANPTFTNTFLNVGTNIYTVSGAASLALAPDWFLEVAGTGTVTVQVVPIQGSQNVPGNPPYMLDVLVSAGVTTCNLVQRFSTNSGLWTSTLNQEVWLYGSFTAKNGFAGTVTLTMNYRESTGSYAPVNIVQGTVTTSYLAINGSSATAIPSSANPATGASAYVDIYLSFPENSHIQVSAIQLIPLGASPATTHIILPDFDSSNRNESYQGDYYIPRLNAKQIDSFLTGWDFPLNPFQLGADSTIASPAPGPITTTAKYIADQTISYSTTTNVAWARNAVTNGITFTPVASNDAFCIMQYLSGAQVKDLMTSRLSVNVFAYLAAAGSNVTMRVYLYRAKLASTIPLLSSGVVPRSIGNVAANGVFTLTLPAIADNWTEIPRSGLPTAQANLNHIANNADINDGINDFGFTGWQITDATQLTDTDKFAIVVTFAYGASDIITVNSISCVPGDLPCRPAVKSFEQTLQECEYYYEKSYKSDVVPGTASNDGLAMSANQRGLISQSGPNVTFKAFPRYIGVSYKIVKRAVATPIYYAPSGVINELLGTIYSTTEASFSHSQNATITTSNWTLNNAGINSFELAPVNRTLAFIDFTDTFGGGPHNDLNPEVVVWFHYIADSRLGIVT